MGRASHLKTIAYTDASPVFSRFLRHRDAWTNGDMYAIRRLPHQLFEGVSAGTFLHANRLSSCCRRGKYPHSTEPVPANFSLVNHCASLTNNWVVSSIIVFNSGRDATAVTPGSDQGQPEQGMLERRAADGGETGACLPAPESTRGGATPGALLEERARRGVRRSGAPSQQRSAGEYSAGPWSVRKSRR